MEYFILNDGNAIPALGSGTNTFGKQDGVYTGDTKEVVSAIRTGYRFFDTAESYGNEETIGTGILESGVERREIYISTKLKTRGRDGETVEVSPEAAEAAIARSLAKLRTDYIDLYLIHHPIEDEGLLKEVWGVLEDYQRRGVLRSIGVCNHDPAQLDTILDWAQVLPAVNQIKISPETPNRDIVSYTKDQGLFPMAWGPLKFSERFREPLDAIGAWYGKTWAQVILRFNFQERILSIPKSHSPEHQKANLDIFDFVLKEEDMEKIRNL